MLIYITNKYINKLKYLIKTWIHNHSTWCQIELKRNRKKNGIYWIINIFLNIEWINFHYLKIQKTRQGNREFLNKCTSSLIYSWFDFEKLILLTSLVNILAKNPFSSPPPQILQPWFFLFFCFRKTCNCDHQRHHFHLRFRWVLSIGWRRWFFVKKLEEEELNIKYFWCGMRWRVLNLSVTL